jgi:uncharacterized protein YegJ (DUF2314 family)
MNALVVGLVAMLLLALAACTDRTDPIVERDGQAAVSMIQGEDREMNQAMAEARRTLDEFERHLSNPSSTQSMAILKGRFTEGETVEHMWINEIEVTAEGYRGVLGNEPMDMTTLSAGQVVVVPRSQVSDWVVVEDGRLVGGYTLRLLRSRLPEDQRPLFDQQNGFRVDD